MSGFLADLWADLRAKRLWPVALVLTAALVAVPVLLLEPAAEESPAPSGGAAAARTQAAVAPVDAPEEGSHLGVFRKHNPFASKADAPPAESDGSGSGTADAGSSAGSMAAAGASTASLSTASTGTGAAPSTGSSGGSTGGSTGGSGDSTPKTELYTYTVDVRFGRAGSERRYDDVKRMELLPSDNNPMLVFLGASVGGDEAVFLVDSTLSQTGEGVCKPSDDTCSFLYLQTHDSANNHSFADSQGRRYNITLLAIQQKKVSAKASSSGRRGVRSKRATARKSAREFLFRPFLLDATRR